MQLQRLNNPLAATILGLAFQNVTNTFQQTPSTALLQIHTSVHPE